jgi:hypothetical protein
VAPNDSLKNINNIRQPFPIGFGKVVEPIAVDIKYAEHTAVAIKDRQDDLRLRRGAAGNMPGELVDVRDDDGLRSRVCVSADTRSEIDSRACKGSLKRTKDELIRFCDVESDPKESERFFENCRDVGQISDDIGFAFDQGFDLRHDLFVDHAPVGGF